MKVDQCGQGESCLIYDSGKIPLAGKYRYFYLKDNDTGEIASLLFVPGCKEITDYCCIHSPGYSEYKGPVWGVNYGIRIYVPLNGTGEHWTISLYNAKGEKDLSLFFVTGLEYNRVRTTDAGWDQDLNCFLHYLK